MLKRFFQIPIGKTACIKCAFSQLAAPIESRVQKSNDINYGELTEPTKPTEKSLLEPLAEDISHISTYLKPTFNLAAYANKSEIIQELVKLGVNLHYIEKKIQDAAPMLLKLKFEDIKDHILFLNNMGVSFEDIGKCITKNPFIFKESLEHLEVRVNYLKFKKFTDEMITRILTKNPFWLSHSTQEMDEKLGFFQKNFNLLGGEVRQVVVMKPQLITFDREKVKLNMFAIKEEMGFSPEDMKQIILKRPAIFMNGGYRLLKTFEYLHNVMKIPHEQIIETPGILNCREKKLKERHQFLVMLKRDQFNASKPNYIALMTMVQDTDTIFATEVAKSSIDTYNMFLKTL